MKNSPATSGYHMKVAKLLSAICQTARVRVHATAIVTTPRIAAGAGPSSTIAVIRPISPPDTRTLVAGVAKSVKTLSVVNATNTAKRPDAPPVETAGRVHHP